MSYIQASIRIAGLLSMLTGIAIAENVDGGRFKVFDPGAGNLHKIFDLPDCRPGDLIRASVDLYNLSNGNIRLVKGQAACACTKVLIPNVEILPGGIEKLEFEFKVNSRRQLPTESFSVSIESSGVTTSYSFVFRTKVVEFANFAVSELHEFGPTGQEERTIALPIVFSVDLELDDLSVAVVPNSPAAKATLAREGEGVSARVLLTESINDQAFELRLTYRETELDSIPVFIARRKLIEVLPSSLIFVVDANSPAEYEANALIRINSDSLKTDALTCMTGTKQQVELTIKQLTRGVARAKVRLNRLTTEAESGGAPQKLIWGFESSSADSRVETPFRFSN